MLIIKNIHSILDQGEHTAGVFGDLEKAFETVNLNILQKLQHHIIRGVTENGLVLISQIECNLC